MTTLENAIERFENNAEFERRNGNLQGCLDFRQFAEWLKDYKRLKEQEPKTGHCKECKYFEYDSVAKVDGVPLIVAHEICNKWGDGCKTSDDGYCFLFEPQETETWHGIHAQITAPKGTFERIFNEADDDYDI